MGKISNHGMIEGGTQLLIYYQRPEGADQEIKEIISATFLPFSESIMFIDQDHSTV